ncbi:iron-sulfur cluster assembly accessory protein [Bacillus atrophaeus]|uniref:HesB/IscA family protein n=1 Tax=Bacillus atrophaeus TaxID=1452 RepID=UPI00227DC992|nr:iron-sulfur cluster assembly accessory protein [Bacillus atrophaeus]MCY8914079.1 iron-sulfur cluster assembly accessory protein [Bacillus atrophaeus]MCY9112962.1 iron-sulfur cluster assembly accessory protein [Bacillus atrophaeus]MEC0925194.1 iron-sulfur cluster assembly accessory protein [Bacillus atrophaeus]MEC0934656.1 iron-sulfur cluster assembly accessory protein [Bacillus atrophaeus]
MSNPVTITEAAALHIKGMMKEHEEENAFLRVGVKGGGCSGLSYGMGFEHEKGEQDSAFEQHGITVLVDNESMDIMNGTIIDFKQSMMGGGFTIDNPNAIASCGCGSSFRTAQNAGKPEEC